MGDVIDAVRQFMKTQLRVAESDTLAADYPLVQRGVLDSIEVMQVVAFLETTYGIRIDDVDVLPENLGSLASMEALVARKRDAAND